MVIPVSFGDIHEFGQSVAVAVRRRNLGIIRRTVWVIRENHRRGTWKPFTFRDYLALRSRRRR
jgi:hypothetical protein